MRNILFMLISLLLCVKLNAQTESCMQVMNEFTKNKDVWTEQEGIDYILGHKESFDIDNELDIWLYNCALGSRYYLLGNYQEALIYLHAVTAVLDKHGEGLGLSSHQQLLTSYYWEANCEFHTGASTDVLLAKLKRAKAVFEQYNYTNADCYNHILTDIELCETGEVDALKDILEKASLAIEYAIRNEYDKAIPLMEKIINNWPESRPKEELAQFCKLLGDSYMAVDRLNDAEQLYLNTLSELEEHH